jgi:prolyl-tRNA synthetase
MQDRKSLQAGTSHFLGQNFSKASNIKFLDSTGKEEFAWTTSWGVSTRLIGGIIMTHGDDDGLIIPPRLAPAHVVILPVIHGDDTRASVFEYCDSLAAELRKQYYDGRPIEVIVDKSEGRGGEKGWGWIKKGIPVYMEIGPRDIASGAVFMGRRDKSRKERTTLPRAECIATIGATLDSLQKYLFERARTYRDANITAIDSKDDFYSYFTPKNAEKPEIHGGFALCHWNDKADVEERVRNDLSVTIRCIPLDANEEPGKCVITGEPSRKRVIFGKSY